MLQPELTFETILQRYMSDTMPLRDAYDLINNDLCRLLLQTRFGKEYLFDMTEEEQEQFSSSYALFEDYETLNISDLQMLKHSLQEQMNYFSPQELEQLGKLLG